MAFDGATLTSSEETQRRGRQRSHLSVGEINIADFLRNVDEQREFDLRKKYLERDLAEALRFGNFKNYILFISSEFDRNLRDEIDQLNNVINALGENDSDQHAGMIEHLQDVKNKFKKRRKRQKTFQDDVGNIKDPKDYNDLETAFADLQKEMKSAKLASQNWRDLYRNYWTDPGAYLAYRAKAKDKAAPAMMAAAAPPAGKSGKPPKNRKADAKNAQLEKFLKSELIALSKVTKTDIAERQYEFLHDMCGEKLVNKALTSLYSDTNSNVYLNMRQTFAKIVTKLHSKKGPGPTGP